MRTSVLSPLGPAWLAGVSLMLLSSAPMFADMFTITTNSDTYISSASAATNFGSATSLLVDSGDTALLGFNLSSLPAGLTAGQVSQATLSFWVTQNTTPSESAVDVALLTSSWTEAGVTFNTRPTVGAPIANDVPVPVSGFFITVDVTSTVQGWITSPIANDGIQISVALPFPDTMLELASRENSINEPANLDITTTTPEPGSIPMLLTAMAAFGVVVVRKRRRVV